MIKYHQDLENSNSSEEKHIWKRLLTTPEGHILEIGLVMTLLFVTVPGFGYLRFQEKAHIFLGMSATNILFGRAAGISFGYSFELENLLVIITNILIENDMVAKYSPYASIILVIIIILIISGIYLLRYLRYKY